MVFAAYIFTVAYESSITLNVHSLCFFICLLRFNILLHLFYSCIVIVKFHRCKSLPFNVISTFYTIKGTFSTLLLIIHLSEISYLYFGEMKLSNAIIYYISVKLFWKQVFMMHFYLSCLFQHFYVLKVTYFVAKAW